MTGAPPDGSVWGEPLPHQRRNATGSVACPHGPYSLAETLHALQAAAGMVERAERAEAAVERVRALHRPTAYLSGPPENGETCRECGADWPCPTIVALDGAE